MNRPTSNGKNTIMKLHRRRFLQALGIGGAATAFMPSLFTSHARAGGATFPTRVVFFVTPHGTVWRNWKTGRTDLPTDRFASAPLTGEADLGPILAPLDRHRSKVLVVEGVARATFYEDYRINVARGGDVNGHSLGRAHALTCSPSVNGGGSTARGGGESIDQYLGRSIRGEAAWASRVWGFNGAEPYSFVARGEPATRTEDPARVYADILSAYTPPTGSPSPTPAPEPMATREQRMQAARGSAAALARAELERIAPRLSGDDRLKLERHRDLLADLERSYGGIVPGGGSTDGGSGPAVLTCDPTYTSAGEAERDFRRLTTLALSCDLTRVVTYTARLPGVTEIGGAPGSDLHERYAHKSIAGEGGFTAEGETVMTTLNNRYAEQFASLLDELDSIPEGDGTLLDHTAVVWTSECATGSHQGHDLPIVIAGGANGSFVTGRRVRYPQNLTVPFTWDRPYPIGPSHTRLFVSLLQAAGLPDVHFGDTTSVTGTDGTVHPLDGPLSELGTA
jgi:hypothetical protein